MKLSPGSNLTSIYGPSCMSRFLASQDRPNIYNTSFLKYLSRLIPPFIVQESAHSRANVRDAMGVSWGLHGASSDAADVTRPLARKRAPHHTNSTRGEAHLPRHPTSLNYPSKTSAAGCLCTRDENENIYYQKCGFRQAVRCWTQVHHAGCAMTWLRFPD